MVFKGIQIKNIKKLLVDLTKISISNKPNIKFLNTIKQSPTIFPNPIIGNINKLK